MKLMINCNTCDARNVSEETLAAYEEIQINCNMLTVTPEAKNLLNRYAVTMNCAGMLEIGKDVLLSSVNGAAQIKPTDQVHEKTYLQVNGALEIAAGTEKVLEQYVGIQVNGAVQYPESMSAYLGKLKVNGAASCYPDGAVVLRRNAVIDRTFVLRTKKKLYWSARRMVMVDPALDAEALARKGATFSSKEVILAEGKVESLLGCIDEQAELVIVPDGTQVVMDDVELNEGTVRRYGSKLYILGDVEIPEGGDGTLEKMEYLHIHGTVKVSQAQKNLLLEKAEIQGEIKTTDRKGRTLQDMPFLKITKWMLEQEPKGLHVEDCLKIRLDKDIPNDLILDRLTICDCGNVLCSPAQEGAVAMVCEDVMKISKEEDREVGAGGLIQGALRGARKLLDTKVVNAGDYVL